MSAQLDGNLAAEQGDMKAAGQDGGVSLPHTGLEHYLGFVGLGGNKQFHKLTAENYPK